MCKFVRKGYRLCKSNGYIEEHIQNWFKESLQFNQERKGETDDRYGETFLIHSPLVQTFDSYFLLPHSNSSCLQCTMSNITPRIGVNAGPCTVYVLSLDTDIYILHVYIYKC